MKYISCADLQNGLRFEYNCIRFCCFTGPYAKEPLYIKKDYWGDKLNWNEIIKKIQTIRENHKNGILQEECIDCVGLQEREWSNSNKFKYLQIAHWSDCNCNCIYCYRLRDDFEKVKKRYKIMPIIKELDKMGMIDYSGEVAYSGGEPASLREFDDITNFFLKKNERLIMVHTNGIKPLKSVLKGLKTDTISVTISVDCGDREKFKQIKQVDAYDKVLDTFKKYIKAQGNNKRMVRSKFILMPSVNNTKEDIDKWLDQSEKIGIQSVILDFETRWFEKNHQNIPEEIDELYQYLVDSTKYRGLDLQFYGIATQYRKERGLCDGGLHQQ